MSCEAESFFRVKTYNSDGTVITTQSNTTTSPTRSIAMFSPALSSLSIHIAGTASVQIISNPFGDATKDIVIQTVTASDVLYIPSAMFIVLNVSSVSGTVTANLTVNED